MCSIRSNLRPLTSSTCSHYCCSVTRKDRLPGYPRKSPGPRSKLLNEPEERHFGGIDNNGDVDMVVSNIGQAPTFLKNTKGNENHWLGLRLVGQKSNRDGIGSTVTVTRSSGQKQRYDVQTAAGYLSASDRRVLIGLEKRHGDSFDRSTMAGRSNARR